MRKDFTDLSTHDLTYGQWEHRRLSRHTHRQHQNEIKKISVMLGTCRSRRGSDPHSSLQN